jgi:protein TonB
VLNVSEGGLRLAAAGFLTGDDSPPMRLRLPGTSEWIETPGQIVWTSKSRKEAGVRFIGLAESDRDRIKNWISLDASQAQTVTEFPKKSEPPPQPVEAPKAAEPQESESAPPPAESSTGSQNSGSDKPTPRASTGGAPGASRYPERERIFSFAAPAEKLASLDDASRDSQIPPKQVPPPFAGDPDTRQHINWQLPARRTVIDGQVGLWLTVIALVSLISIISFTLGMATGRGAWSEVLAKFGIGDRNAKALTSAEYPNASAALSNMTPSDPALQLENLPLPPASGQSLEIPVQPVRKIEIPRESFGASASRAAAVPVPTKTSPERVTKVTSFVAEPEKIPPPAVKPPENTPVAVAAIAPVSSKPPDMAVDPTGTIEIFSDPYPTIRTPSNPKPPPSASGTSLRIGHAVSRIEPAYPQEALRQRIAGTVKLHVLIARDGSTERVELLDGPAYLTEAARAAVQKWSFEPTLLGGEPVEAEENISIVFRIANATGGVSQ